MGTVHFVGGEKGGVGKSMTARVLAQYCIDHDQPFLGFDCDSSHGTFSRFYSEFSSPIVVGEEDSLDGMLAAIEEYPDRDLIIDLAAQAAQPLGKWIEETDVFGLLDELGYQVCLWHVMDDGADSVALLDDLLARYSQPSVDFVIVQNLGRGSDFSRFKKSETFQKATGCGALIIELPKLQSKLTQKIDFNNSSFWAVANDKGIMNIAERQRMKVWLRNAYEQLDQLG
ncbi:mobilization protein [Marinomonas sp. A79]|uniref:Mobilization protein n=1 Tax=Marinomonas vulgaris TaxID=2823372 RepID=A0ABS5HBD3_9GAMM|nr:mobilization protein [Marinomonas vulgaris]MBR7888966.1 mobilization protein [Marinomonas vulgaris]